MEIPLQLKKRKDGRVSYGLPLWYRIIILGILGIIVGSMSLAEGSPGAMAWILVVLLALSLLYEERWTINPSKQSIEHRVGIFPILRTTSISFSSISYFSIGIFARGTVPGSADEAAIKEKGYRTIYGEQLTEDGHNILRSFSGKKPYATLLLVTKEDDTYLVDTLPAKKADRLLKAGAAFAEACGTVCHDRDEP
ncbi:MAG: hypothetical protein LLF89_06520 [Spirochaetaceae bacterium]|nr:hypothetical protein [Spirochaetaceae bacterium]